MLNYGLNCSKIKILTNKKEFLVMYRLCSKGSDNIGMLLTLHYDTEKCKSYLDIEDKVFSDKLLEHKNLNIKINRNDKDITVNKISFTEFCKDLGENIEDVYMYLLDTNIQSNSEYFYEFKENLLYEVFKALREVK